MRCALYPHSIITVLASLIVSGLDAFKKNIDALAPILNFFCPILRNKLRMFIVTSPKSIFTGHGVKHL